MHHAINMPSKSSTSAMSKGLLNEEKVSQGDSASAEPFCGGARA